MDYETLAESGFTSLDRNALRSACKDVGIAIGPNTSEDAMREKLCAMFGKAAPAPAKKVASIVDDTPNLFPSDGKSWGGKWYDVTVQSSNPEVIKTCVPSWEGWAYPIPLNQRVSIPAPFMKRLRDAVGETIQQVRVTDPATGTVRYDKVKVPTQQYVISVHGPTPGTEHLPEDALDYYQQRARATNNFAGFPRKKLTRIHSDLYGTSDAKKLREMKEEDIREEILAFLGPEFQYDEAA